MDLPGRVNPLLPRESGVSLTKRAPGSVCCTPGALTNPMEVTIMCSVGRFGIGSPAASPTPEPRVVSATFQADDGGGATFSGSRIVYAAGHAGVGP